MSYHPTHTIKSHTNSVNCLAFSNDGKHLASGSDDHTVFVHECERGIEIQKVVGKAPVTSLLWIGDEIGHEKLFVGYGDGKLLLLDVLSPVVDGAQYPINADCPLEWMELNPESGLLAICSARDVRIWRRRRPTCWAYVGKVLHPAADPTDGADAPSPRSAHWLDGERLLVAYMAHGILCWNIRRRLTEWQIASRKTRIGRSSLSPDKQFLVVSNLCDGYDLYRLKDQLHLRTFKGKSSVNVPLPVLFIHDGRAVLTGSDTGRAMIYDSATTLEMQSLPHGRHIIQALAKYDGSTRLLATATSEAGANTVIRVWQMEKQCILPACVEPTVELACAESASVGRVSTPAAPLRPLNAEVKKSYASRSVNTSMVWYPQKDGNDATKRSEIGAKDKTYSCVRRHEGASLAEPISVDDPPTLPLTGHEVATRVRYRAQRLTGSASHPQHPTDNSAFDYVVPTWILRLVIASVLFVVFVSFLGLAIFYRDDLVVAASRLWRDLPKARTPREYAFASGSMNGDVIFIG